MAQFIDIPVETDPDALTEDALAWLAENVPGFNASEGALHVWMIRAGSRIAASIRDLQADVPPAIFRRFGADLLNLPPDEAAPAQATSTWTMRDTLGHTIPAGTIVSIAADGDTSLAFQVVADVVVPAGSSSTAAGQVALEQVLDTTSGEGGASANGLTGAPELVDVLDFVQSIALVGATSSGADAESDDDYLDRLRSLLQLLSPAPILPRDFAIIAQGVAGVYRATAIDLYDPTHNLLTVNQGSVETDATGFAAITNASVARSTAQAATGAASLAITATGAGTAQGGTSTGTSGVPVTAGVTYTGRLELRAAATARSCQAAIRWYTAAGAFISQSSGTAVNDTTTGWTVATVTAAAPATAAFGQLSAVIGSAAASEVHYIDRLAFREGTRTEWTAGGSPATGVARAVSVAAIDEAGNAVSTGTKAAIESALAGLREVNFRVFAIDPTYTTVSVTFTATALPGYDVAEVEANAEAAVAAYLNPATWGQPSNGTSTEWTNTALVRYLEVAAIIDRVDGIDHVDGLALNGGAVGANVTLGGAAPLPLAGTIAGTVSAP